METHPIAGHSDVASGNRLIYAMRVEQIITFKQYADDPEYTTKIPRFDQSWREACGDNIYVLQANGRYRQRKSLFHPGKAEQEQDTRGNRVFISRHFYYFGANSVPIPDRFDQLIWRRQGIKTSHSPEVADKFLAWLRTSYDCGIHGDPRELSQWRPTFVPTCKS